MPISDLRSLAAISILALSGCAYSGVTGDGEAAQAGGNAPAQEKPLAPSPNSPFIGDYNGGGFETAMGMRIAADGTFQWGLSVGALDMRAKGTWEQRGETITLTSDPKPVAPLFRWSGLETAPSGPMVKVVWASNGEPFQYARVTVTCADGSRIQSQVRYEGWSPAPGECADPISLRLEEDIYQIFSQDYVLADLGWKPGSTMRFEFERNDLGVADFTGMVGMLDGNVLKFVGGSLLGQTPQPGEMTLELRKVMPRIDE
ncbi:MAG: hypothetical protein AAGL68_00570 [Pseudomonadota bacterium]